MSECLKATPPRKDQAEAIKAVHEGRADSHQQRLALAYICNELSRAQDLLYIPGSHDETAFLNGRAFVGQKILKIINVPIGQLVLTQTEELPNERD